MCSSFDPSRRRPTSNAFYDAHPNLNQVKRLHFTDHVLFAHENMLAARLRALYAHYYSEFLRENTIAKSWRAVMMHLGAMQRLVADGLEPREYNDNDNDNDPDASTDASSSSEQLQRYASAVSLFLERVSKFRQLTARLQACWEAVVAERNRVNCKRTRLKLLRRPAQLYNSAQADELQELVSTIAGEKQEWTALQNRLRATLDSDNDEDVICRLVAKGKVTTSKAQLQEVQRRELVKKYRVCVKLLVNGSVVGWSPPVPLHWATFSAPCGVARPGHNEHEMFANNFLNAPASHGPSHVFRLKLQQRPKSVRLEVYHYRPFWWSERLGSVHVKVPQPHTRDGRSGNGEGPNRAAYSFVPETHDYVFTSDKPMRAHRYETNELFFPVPQGDTDIDNEDLSPLATWKVEPRCCGHLQVCSTLWLVVSLELALTRMREMNYA